MPTFWTKVDDMIRGLNHVEIVLDDDDAVPAVDESIQAIQEPADVGKVQSGGRLIEYV